MKYLGKKFSSIIRNIYSKKLKTKAYVLLQKLFSLKGKKTMSVFNFSCCKCGATKQVVLFICLILIFRSSVYIAS